MIAIVKKELRAALREKLGWAVLASVPLLLVVVSAFNLGAEDYQGWPEPAAQVGRGLFALGAHLQVLLLLAILPAYSALNLVREKERRTLETLQVVPMRVEALHLGKLVGPALLGWLSVLLALPALAALGFLGGVEPWEPLLTALAAVPAALAASAAGLALGSLAGSSAAAVLLSGVFSFFAVAFTAWPIGAGADNLLAAAMPSGAARVILDRQLLGAFGWTVPGLLPALLLQGLAAGCLFFAGLPALASPYRRRALPVRALGAAAVAVALVLGTASLVPVAGSSGWATGPASAILVLVCLVTPALLLLERVDTMGVLRVLPESAEERELAAGSWAHRLAASPLGLALLPALAAMPGLAVLMAHVRAMSPSPERLDLAGRLAGCCTFILVWGLFCAAWAALVAHRPHGWWRLLDVQALPVAVLALGLGLQGLDLERWAPAMEPIGVGKVLSNSGFEAPSQLAAAVAGYAVAAGCLAALAFMLRRRRGVASARG